MRNALWGTLFSLGTMGCADALIQHGPPAKPYDAVIVLGCPTLEDGSLTRCQLGRAGHASALWSKGWAKAFIVSGAAVHTPYVEAEAIAMAMVELGVPADKIWLETDALHTDENVYYSMKLAKKLGFEDLAVASNGGHAAFACKMMMGWGHPCKALAMDIPELERIMPPHEAKLRAIRAHRVEDWVDLDDLEERMYWDTGRSRLPSFLLYPLLAGGSGYLPIAPTHLVPVTWSERASQVGMGKSTEVGTVVAKPKID
jgi:vancomycin permeability regulator SanA